MATDDDKQLKAHNKSVILKRLNLSLRSLKTMSLRMTGIHWMIKVKVRELIFVVLLQLFIFKLFRFGFNNRMLLRYMSNIQNIPKKH